MLVVITVFLSSHYSQLRELCRNYGARVSFETANTRDTFYRTAVQLVHNVCVRYAQYIHDAFKSIFWAYRYFSLFDLAQFSLEFLCVLMFTSTHCLPFLRCASF